MKPKQILKNTAQAIAGMAGLELHRKSERSTLTAAMRHLAQSGFRPKAVIDVGAASGTLELYETFPDAGHWMIEPLEEFHPRLNQIAKKYRSAQVIPVAASSRIGEITFNVHQDLYGSSLYQEVERSDVNGVPRTVRTITLDSLVENNKLEAPILLKVDVQGAELDVMTGAEKSMRLFEYIILETALFQFYRNGPQLADVVAFMKAHGFVVYEIMDAIFRPLDNAMSQVDLAFVKENGIFRRSHAYATPQQRAMQNRRMKE